jgi:hypothetical protein
VIPVVYVQSVCPWIVFECHFGVISPSWLYAGNYDEYFGMATDVEAVVYLMLMNTMIHDYFPTAITIGEDVSGMPTFCR